MIANAAWKPAKTRAGTVKTASSGSIMPWRKRNSSGLPMKPPMELPKAIEKPTITQRTPTMPIVVTDIMSMLSTLLARTMPP